MIAEEAREPRRGPIARVWSSSAVRYLVVGGVAFLIDVGLLALLHDIFGVALAIATPVAFLLSFAVTYVLQRTFTFRSSAGIGPSAIKYTALVAFNTLATTGIVSLAPALGLPWIVGKVVAVGSTTVWNYFCYQYWIFPRDRRSPQATEHDSDPPRD